MDTSKAKNKAQSQNKGIELKNLEFSVSHVRVWAGNQGDTVWFDLTVNGVTIYGCRVVAGKNGDFVGFPNRKSDKDNKYYNIAYVPLNDDQTKSIMAAIQEELNK